MRLLLSISFFITALSGFGQAPEWATFYEKSGKKDTPRYRETLEFCRKMDKASPLVTTTTFGKSAQGRDLPLMIIDNQGLTDPESIRKTGKAIVLIQACIHPGECEGKDAGLMLIRDMVFGKPPSNNQFPASGIQYPLIELLNHVSILFIPIFNVDGHERFGPYNRINQNGPREMGWRVNANNLNLNRDYLKADTPEMQAWLKMFNRWMPDFFIDTHTTDGADYQYQLTYSMDIFGDMETGLSKWSEEVFLKNMTSGMEAVGIPVFPYIEFRDWHNPKSGLETAVSPPMLSQAYTSLRNRPGLLIETHMLKPYDQRVTATYQCLKISLGIINKESKNLTALIKKADDLISNADFRKKDFPLKFKTLTNDSTMVTFMGIGYNEVKSDITGETWFKYGDEKTTFLLPYFDKTEPVKVTKLPEAYIVPAEWKTVIDRLAMHGIRFYLLQKDTVISVTGFRFNDPKWQSTPYEGRHMMTNIAYQEISLERNFPAGSAIVVMDQPSARIIAHILEPDGDGSYLSWGFFDAIFEQKEFAEHYVMEPLSRKMLDEDPALKAEFVKKKEQDQAFSKNPNAILTWFYSKTQYWDKNKDLYPVGKIFDRKLLDGLIKNQPVSR
ncbi:MAG: M14 family metallopeptidase [Bacteroidales bacterium]|jgi:hypothetical protein|nr:M14 family metallopeptidase [Bacteroidales bacterium]